MTPQRYNAWVKTGKVSKEKLAKKGVTRDEFLKAPDTRTAARIATERAVVARLVQILPRPSVQAITANVQSMTGGEMRIAMIANADKIRRLASRKADRTGITGKEINPYWYH